MYESLRGQLAFAYLRISEDREGKELGVQRQEEDIRSLATQLGVEIVRVFCDNDISASTNSDKYRPDYDEMLTLAEAGPVKIIIAYTKSRLTRDPSENERQIRLARKHKVQYYYVRGQALDLQVSANRKMDRIQAALDAGVAEDIQELAMRKKLQNAREGKWDGGVRTFGYGKVVGYDPNKKRDILDPYQVREEEIAALKEGKRRTLAGDSQFVCVRSWNDQGILTPRAGQETKNKKTGKVNICDGRWDVGRFKRTMLNESYVQFDPTGHPTDCPCLKNPETGGTRVHKDERHRAMWPFVFTRAEHDAMVVMFNGRDVYWSNKGHLKGRTYLLSGFVECGGTWTDTEKQGQYCGGEMRGQGKVYDTKNGRIRQRRYACKKWNRDGSRLGCCTVFRIADAVEAYVTEQVLERFDSPEVIRALTPTDNEERMNEVVQQMAELQARREQLAREYAAGEHEKDDYRVMVKTIKDKTDILDAEKRQLVSAKAKSLAVPTDGGLREIWKTASIEWRASVIKLIVEKVIIHPGKPGGRKWKSEDGKIYNFNPDLIEIVWLV